MALKEASDCYISSEDHTPHTSRDTQLEQGQRLALSDVPAGTGEVESRRRYRITITSRRRRLLDHDNACLKFAIDALRHNGLIEDDNPGVVSEVNIRQEKIQKGEEPETVIEIEEVTGGKK